MGGVASFQFQVGPAFSMPTLAPVLSGSLSASGALTLRWPAVATGQTTEVQQVNASGQQVSLFAGGVSVVGGTGTEEPDAQGVYCLLASGTSCVLQLPAGFTGAFRARTIGGGVATAPAGPWSNVVAESIPAGTPNISYRVSSVSWGAPPYSVNDYVVLGFTVTATNTGTAAGSLYSMFAVVDSQAGNRVAGSGQAFTAGSLLAPGATQSVRVGGVQVGLFGFTAVPNQSGFVLHVAPSTPKQSYGRYLYEQGQTFSPSPGDTAFPLTYTGPQWPS